MSDTTRGISRRDSTPTRTCTAAVGSAVSSACSRVSPAFSRRRVSSPRVLSCCERRSSLPVLALSKPVTQAGLPSRTLPRAKERSKSSPTSTSPPHMSCSGRSSSLAGVVKVVSALMTGKSTSTRPLSPAPSRAKVRGRPRRLSLSLLGLASDLESKRLIRVF